MQMVYPQVLFLNFNRFGLEPEQNKNNLNNFF